MRIATRGVFSHPLTGASRLLAAALVTWALLSVALIHAGVAEAQPRSGSPGRALAGGAACTLLEGVPGAADPIRRARPFRRAFAALDRAGSSAAANRRAFERFSRTLDKLMSEARRVFHPAAGEVQRPAARRFLERYVFGRDAVLRVGLERFEPRPEVVAAMTLAACRAGETEAAIAHARRITGPDNAPVRALGALLLLDAGRVAEARELASELGEGGFLAPWVAAELTADPAERLRLHALAARRVSTPDQQTAVAEQRRRYGLP